MKKRWSFLAILMVLLFSSCEEWYKKELEEEQKNRPRFVKEGTMTVFTNLSLMSELTVGFSKEMDIESVNGDNVYLEKEIGGSPKKVELNYRMDEGDKILVITPKNPLDSFSVYTLTIQTGNTGVQGKTGGYFLDELDEPDGIVREIRTRGVIFIDANSTYDQDPEYSTDLEGLSWKTALTYATHLQTLVDNYAYSSGENSEPLYESIEVWVKSGSYSTFTPGIDELNGGSFRFFSDLNVKLFVYGGFKGDEYELLENRDPSKTIFTAKHPTKERASDHVLLHNEQDYVDLGYYSGVSFDSITFANGDDDIGGRNNGAGIHTLGGTFKNCIIRDNKTDQNGGGVYSSNATFINCTFVNNSAVGSGGGVYAESGTFTNCLFWNNSATVASPQIFFNSGVVIENCAVMGGLSEGTAIINLAEDNDATNGPKFFDPVQGDFRLKADSPCVGSGKEGGNIGALGVAN